MSDFSRHEGGRGWTDLQSGHIVLEEWDGDAGGIVRSKGEPITMLMMWEDFGAAIVKASGRFGVPRQWIMGMIAIEATRLASSRHFNPQCVREEPGYTSDEATPHRVSPGLMQTLISTADGENRRCSVYMTWDNAAHQKVTRQMLMQPERSIMLGTSYMARQIERYGMSSLRVCASYNAGSLRTSDRNEFKMLAYGPTRLRRFSEWSNDALAVLETVA